MELESKSNLGQIWLKIQVQPQGNALLVLSSPTGYVRCMVTMVVVVVVVIVICFYVIGFLFRIVLILIHIICVLLQHQSVK